MVHRYGSLQLTGTRVSPCILRTEENIQKVENCLHRKKRVSAQKLSFKLDMSKISVWRIPKKDSGLKPYRKLIELLLSDNQKIRSKQYANSVRTNFREEDTLRILFSDDKFFDIDGVFNYLNK
jgi:hypothetical protein